jgi:hypothetical protein
MMDWTSRSDGNDKELGIKQGQQSWYKSTYLMATKRNYNPSIPEPKRVEVTEKQRKLHTVIKNFIIFMLYLIFLGLLN